jgi:hypothetical protein
MLEEICSFHIGINSVSKTDDQLLVFKCVIHSIVHSKDPRVGLVSLVVAALVTLLVHVVGVLLGVVLGLLTVNPVHTLGLGELVDLTSDQAGDELLGERVVDFLAYSLIC